MMSRRRPMNLELAGPAFDLKNLSSEDQGSLEALPMCAARCEPMSRIMDHLYIGSWRDIENPDALRSEGVTHILNVAKEVAPTHHDTMEGFTSLHIPLVDEHRENIIENIEEACRFINEAAANFGKCLVHCRRGISRSPAIVVGYLMHEKGFEYQDAVDYVKSSRKCTSLNIAFREFLMSYDVPPMRTDREQSATFDDAHDNGNAPSSGTDARFDDRASEEEDEEESSTNHGTGFEANAHAGPSSFAAAAKFEDDAPEEEDEGSAPAASCGPSLLRPFGRHDGLAVDPVLVRVGESQGSPRPV